MRVLWLEKLQQEIIFFIISPAILEHFNHMLLITLLEITAK